MARKFECRAACSKITNERTKIQWCRSVIGSVGRQILKGLSERDGWDEAQQELRRYVGEGDSRAAAWKKFRSHQAKGRCYGEIGSKVRELAVRTADEEDVREHLAFEAFLGAIPWPFAREIRMKKIKNLEEALVEARKRRAIEEEEEGGKKKIHAAAAEREVVRQTQDVGPGKDRRSRGAPVCLGCGEQGHILRECPLRQEFR